MSLGDNIRNRREQLKLSQEFLAQQLGVSRQAVSKWETGQSEPTASNLVKLAQVLETTLSELVDPDSGVGRQEGDRAKKAPNPILRANLIKMAIVAQAAFLYNCTCVIYQLQNRGFSNKELYRGVLVFSLAMLLLSSIWMAANHLYEQDMQRRRRNTRIELGYCFVQLIAGLLTIRFGMGLVGALIIIAISCVYVLYINPKFMARKLTR